MLQLLIILTFK